MSKRHYSLRENPLFGGLPLELSENLRELNPWWRGEPPNKTPPQFHRWPFARLLHHLTKGLTPATVLRGPRRVGKTILLQQIIENLTAHGVSGSDILYVPFDDLPTIKGLKEPVQAITRWFSEKIVQLTLGAADRAGRRVFLFFDEVQNLDSWAEQIKNLVDNQPVRVLLTGSSSLRIEAGRDSLAGRITTVDLGPLLLREIAEVRGLACGQPYWNGNSLEEIARPEFWAQGRARAQADAVVRREAFQMFSARGAFPIAHDPDLRDTPWEEVAAYLNESIIKRAIQHDLRMGARGKKRDERLLEEVFRICCRWAGQAPSPSAFLPDIQQTLAGNIGAARIGQYMKFLDGTLLLRLVEPLELRLKRRKSAPKICLCDHSLRAGWLQEIIPLDPGGLLANPHLTDLAGRLAESILGYFLASIPNLGVAHFPERGAEPEVDFVLTVGLRRIPVEVKYRRRIDPHDDTRGLRSFIEKSVYNAPFGILVTLDDDVSVPDPRIIPMSLSSLLWLR